MAKKQKYTFYQWCIDNNRYDLLDRWDYDMTGFGPNDITYASAKPVYFKCPNNIHKSSKRLVYVITNKNADQRNFRCIECMKEYPIMKDITGNVYGELTVIGPDFDATNNHNGNGTYWKCLCSCGNEVSVFAGSLKDGKQVTCGDRKVHRSGNNNSNWKGGITPKLISDRMSDNYNKWRDAIYAKDWYTCQCCGEYSNIEKNAHHINNFAEHEDIKYDILNGILLCSNCHHIKCIGSFHNLYGTHNNTPEQLEEYINSKRKSLGIDIPFSIDSYLSGNILHPGDISFEIDPPWIFDTIRKCKLENNYSLIAI